jgi:hypothetical protein
MENKPTNFWDFCIEEPIIVFLIVLVIMAGLVQIFEND